MRLQGRRALVTGAAHGIGLACAQALAREGADVVLTDIDVAGVEAAATALALARNVARNQRSRLSWCPRSGISANSSLKLVSMGGFLGYPLPSPPALRHAVPCLSSGVGS